MKLSAEELNAETLFPGDTIEYYSMVRASSIVQRNLQSRAFVQS